MFFVSKSKYKNNKGLLLEKPLLLRLVQNDGTPVSTRVDTDTGVGSVSNSLDTISKSKEDEEEEALSGLVVLKQNPASFRG